MYSQFAAWYDRIFPYSATVFTFLQTHCGAACGPILDLGCGTGEYCAAWTALGVQATGIDSDAAMIAKARERAPQAAFHVLDLREFPSVPGPWGLISCIGNTAAHVQQSDFWACVDAVAATLAPGGRWIVQVMNWDFVLGRTEHTFPLTIDDAVFHRAYEEITETRVIFSTALDVGGERIFAERFPLYPIRTADMIAGHQQRGFSLCAHTGDYMGRTYDPAAFSANIFVFEHCGSANVSARRRD